MALAHITRQDTIPDLITRINEIIDSLAVSANAVFAESANTANFAETANSANTANTASTANNSLFLGGANSSFYTNASNLSTGTVADARLPTTIPRLAANNDFSGQRQYVTRAGEVAFGLYNAGGQAQWEMRQKEGATSHSFFLSKLVAGTYTDYLELTTAGQVESLVNVKIGKNTPLLRFINTASSNKEWQIYGNSNDLRFDGSGSTGEVLTLRNSGAVTFGGVSDVGAAAGELVIAQGKYIRGFSASGGSALRLLMRTEVTLVNGSFVTLGFVTSGLWLLFNATVGGSALIYFQNGSQPVIISQIAGFTWVAGTTGSAVPSNGILVADNSTGSLQLKCDAGRHNNIIWATLVATT